MKKPQAQKPAAKPAAETPHQPTESELAQGRAALGDDPDKPQTLSGEAAALARAAATDATPEPKQKGPAESVADPAAAPTPERRTPRVMEVVAPVPNLEDLPPHLQQHASWIVKSKPKSRRRAGYDFTREETLIPFAALSDEQRAAIEGDPLLVLSLRVTEPGDD